jgi:hypothetical protein
VTVVWTKEVTLRFTSTSREVVISGTRAAFKLLSTRWPVTSGAKFWAAQEVCLAALDGRASDEEARGAFIEAAAEAKIRVS